MFVKENPDRKKKKRIYGRLEFFFSTRIKIELNTINFAQYSGLKIDMLLQGNKI